MANGRVFPSATQGGLSRGAAVILETMLRRRELSQRDRQLSQQDRALDLREEAAAMERLLNFAPFLPGDAPLAELPFLHEDIRTVFGEEVDPSNPEDIGAISLNQRNLQTAVEDRLKGMVDELPDDSPFFQRGVSRAILGEPVSEEELEAQEAQAITQRQVAEITSESFDALMRDPQAQAAIQRSLTGLEVPVRVRLPDGREIAFDTEAAARLTTQLWMFSQELSLKREEMAEVSTENIGEVFREQLNEAGLVIGPAQVQRIMGAWNASVSGDFEAGETPFEQLARSYAENGEWEELAAMQLWNGVLDTGNQSINTFLDMSEPGKRHKMGLGLLNHLQESTPKFTAEMHDALAPSVLEFFQQSGAPQIEDPIFGGPRFVLPDIPGGTEERERDPAPAVGPDQRLEQGMPPISPEEQAQLGRPEGATAASEQDMIRAANMMQADAEALAAGTVSLTEIRERYQDPELVRAIVRASQRIRRGGGG